MASPLAYMRAPAASPGNAVATAPTAYTTQCPPPCPACGGLECLCRPRFFPGQVLTDDDLNRMENYIIAKNRLHNRYFQGSGVVCGLEVVCDPCGTGNVTVNPGYALAPCGDDIIVCNAASVSICDLINKCKPRQDNCDPYSSFNQPVDCKQGVQRWVLSICYQETASRGVQPLMTQPCSCGSGGCGGGCGCGCGGSTSGSSAGSCGCGGKATSMTKSSTASTSTAAGKYNPQCEPTLICEGFTFTATRYVDPKLQQSSDLGRYGSMAVLAAKSAQLGPLMSRLLACYLKAAQIRDAYSNQPASDNLNDVNLAVAYSDYAAALRDFAAEHASHHCDLARKIACLDLDTAATSPAAGAPAARIQLEAAQQLNPAALWQARFQSLDTVWLELLQDCICSALLPPCLGVEGGNCVPLAVVTINADTCVVTEVCNWTAREFALTLPTLFYWTSFINWGALKDVIAQLCCGDTQSRAWTLILDALAAIVKNNSGALFETANTAVRKAASSKTGAPGSTGSLATLQALGGFLQQATMPDGMARLLNTAQGSSQAGTPAPGEISELKATISELQKTVATHRSQIEQLMKGR